MTAMDESKYPPQIVSGDSIYDRDFDADQQWVIYKAPGAMPFRAKWDDKRSRLFFVAVHDRNIKLWLLPDVASSVFTATNQTAVSRVKPSKSNPLMPTQSPVSASPTDAPFGMGSMMGGSPSFPPRSESALSVTGDSHPLPTTRSSALREAEMFAASARLLVERDEIALCIDATEASERQAILRQAAAQRQLVQQWSRRRIIFTEETKYIENIEAEERQRLTLWETSDLQALLRQRTVERTRVYSLLALFADEHEQRQLLRSIENRVFHEVLNDLHLRISTTRDLFGARAAPMHNKGGREARMVQSLCAHETFQRALLEKNEAAEVAYLFGRKARDVVSVVDAEALDYRAGEPSLIERAYSDAALPFSSANVLLEAAVLGLGTLFRDFVISQGKIYHEYIRALWGRPVFFFRSELESHAYRYFERKYGPRFGVMPPSSPVAQVFPPQSPGGGGTSRRLSVSATAAGADDTRGGGARWRGDPVPASGQAGPYSGAATFSASQAWPWAPSTGSGAGFADLPPPSAAATSDRPPAAFAVGSPTVAAMRRFVERRKLHGLLATPSAACLPPSSTTEMMLHDRPGEFAEATTPWDARASTMVSLRPFGEVTARAPAAMAITKQSATTGTLSRSVRVQLAPGSRMAVGFAAESGGVFFGWCSDGSLTLSTDMVPAGDLNVNFVDGDTITVTLDFDELALLVAKNGDDFGVAFRFTGTPDPEPLRFAVCFSAAGDGAVLL